MADCFSLPNVVELLREIERLLSLRDNDLAATVLENNDVQNAMIYASDAIEALLVENAKLKEAFDRCYESNENLYNELQEVKADRDAAVAEVEELNDDFVECVCSGYGNLL